MPDILSLLHEASARRGVTVTDCGNGHYQLRGPHLLVNYYPTSKNKTAYVAGTKEGVQHCDVQTAVAMACQPGNATRACHMPEPRQGPARVDETHTYTLYGRVVTEDEFRAAPKPTGPSPPWD